MELALGVAVTHTLGARAAALNSAKDTVNVTGTAPLLVREDITFEVLFAALDKIHVRLHTVRLEVARELSGDGSTGMQTGQGDELQNEAFLGNVPDKRLEGLLAETVGHPVERRRQVIHQALAGVHLTHSTAELAGNLDVGVASLDPEKICVGTKGQSTLRGRRHAGLEMVEALAGTGDVPVEVDGCLGVVGGKGAAARDAHIAVSLCGGEVLGNLVLGDAFAAHVRHGGLIKGDKLGILDPCGFEAVDFGAAGTTGLHGLDGLGEGLNGSVGDTEDELVIADVNGRRDELAGLGVGAGNHEVLGAHDVPLEAGGIEAVDVLASRDEDLAGKMAALLATMELVFKVHGSSAILGKQLGQLEDGRQTAVAGITIGNDGTEVVGVRRLGALFGRHLAARIPLLAVVHRLGLGHTLHLVGDRVVRVVTKVGGDFVGRCEERRAGPAREVEDFLVGSLLGHLDRVNGADLMRLLVTVSCVDETMQLTGVNGLALGRAFLNQVKQLGSHDGAGVRDALRSTLGHDVGCAVRSLDASVARGSPPSFNLLELGLVEGIFSLTGLLRLGQKLERVLSRDA